MALDYYNSKTYEARRSIGYLIRSSSNMITTQMEAAFVDSDVNFIQFVVLMHLRDKLAKTAAELCSNLRYDSGALTRVIDQLENNKFLKRVRSTDDRRVVELLLTAKGVKTAEALLPVVYEKYNSWLDEFSPKEADQLIELLIKLRGKICQGKRAG